MTIEKGAIYRRPDETTPSFFVRVSDVVDGHVLCAPQFGGFQNKIPMETFSRLYEEVSKAELQKIASTFVVEHFDFDEWDSTIPGWSNLSRWNGWGCPYFERDVIVKAIDEGVVVDPSFSRILVLDEGMVTIQAMAGVLPEEIDWEPIISTLKADGVVYDYEVAPGVPVDGEFFPMTVIEADGRLIETYPLGAGSWCWNTYSEPRSDNNSTPSP